MTNTTKQPSAVRSRDEQIEALHYAIQMGTAYAWQEARLKAEKHILEAEQRATAEQAEKVALLEAENARLREYHDASEDIFRAGLLNASLEQIGRRRMARAAIVSGQKESGEMSHD